MAAAATVIRGPARDCMSQAVEKDRTEQPVVVESQRVVAAADGRHESSAVGQRGGDRGAGRVQWVE